MKHIITTFLLLLIVSTTIKAQSHQEEIVAFQKELNKEYRDAEKSPLTDKDRETFTEHPFFPINEKYHIVAKFVRNKNAKPFKMKTTTSRLPTYEKYGTAIFKIDGKKYKLSIYQSYKLRETEEYKDYLFIPFMDFTNGTETYGGGRYIDLSIPTGNTIVIDFNKAYQPYCAYSKGYSCPIPPAENRLRVRIEAGVKKL